MVEELFLKDGLFVSKEDWHKKIANLNNALIKPMTDKIAAASALESKLVNAIIERVPMDEPFGVMFSGGVDSSFIALIAKRSGKKFTCYTIGFKEEGTKQPEDVDAAIEAAKLIGVDINVRVLSISDAESIIRRTVKMLGPELNNVVNIGVGAVVLACIDLAKEDGVNYLFSGLGSEEVFAGYERHKKASDVHTECWNGLFNMYERDLLRDYAISKATGMRFFTPFLDKDVILAGMSVPASFKMNSEHSKLILRELAEAAGLPREVAWRKKRAAQYGSRLDRAIDKLGRKNGFMFKKDYLHSLE